jgi:AraC-like DNA-binding protein
MPAAFKCFRPPSLLSVVDAIWDMDVPDKEIATALTIKHAPGTSLVLVAQYRTPVRAKWQFHGKDRHPADGYKLFAGQTGVVSTRPTGPLGVISVCLKPEAAARMISAPMRDCADTRIDLRSIFNTRDASLLEDMLSVARNSRERITTVEAFLLRRMSSIQPDSVACHAAMLLRYNPALRVRCLATKLDISESQLQRRFQATFSIGLNGSRALRESRGFY